MTAAGVEKNDYPLKLDSPQRFLNELGLEAFITSIEPLHSPNRPLFTLNDYLRELRFAWRDYLLGVGRYQPTKLHRAQRLTRWIYTTMRKPSKTAS